MSGGTVKHPVEQGEKVGDYVVHLDGWDTHPPTVEGLYFVYVHHDKYPSGPNVVEVAAEKNTGILGVFDSGGDFEPCADYGGPLKTYWLGPLPVPEPPKERE